ncbi:hypothetical protein GFS31_04820 [Leptolyngbya sp. BL0902]|nr:hypothetical protein GFS31_04820 [Leptolyngbya sp. BL0902]
MAIVFSGSAVLASDQRLLASVDGPSQEVISPEGAGRDVPWWPWILALPGLGALLWWRLREAAPPSAKTVATPKSDRGLGLGNPVEGDRAKGLATVRGVEEAPPSIDAPTAPRIAEEERDLSVPIPLATVTLGTDVTAMAQRRIILTPRTSTAAYVYWELPPSEVSILADRRYSTFLKLHDADDETPVNLPAAAQIWACATVAMGDQHLPIARAHRHYRVELGYEDEADTWHTLVQSAPVRVPAQADVESSSLTAADGATGSAMADSTSDIPPEERLSGGSLLEVSTPDPTQPPNASHIPGLTEVSISVAPAAIPRTSSAPARASLTAATCRSAEADWELSADQVNDLRTGKRRLTVRLYDVTELPGGFSLGPNSVQEFEVDLVPQASLTLPIAIDDRDYLIEVGYLTGSGQWQVLAKSSPVRVPAC